MVLSSISLYLSLSHPRLAVSPALTLWNGIVFYLAARIPIQPMPISPKFFCAPKWWCQRFHMFLHPYMGDSKAWARFFVWTWTKNETSQQSLKLWVKLPYWMEMSSCTYPHLAQILLSPLSGCQRFHIFVCTWMYNETSQLSLMLWLKLKYGTIMSSISLHLYSPIMPKIGCLP